MVRHQRIHLNANPAAACIRRDRPTHRGDRAVFNDPTGPPSDPDRASDPASYPASDPAPDPDPEGVSLR